MDLRAGGVALPASDRGHAAAGSRAAGRPGRLLSGGLRRWPLVVLLLVATAFTAACLREAWLDSLTIDEPVYVAAGVLGAVHHDVAYNQEHEPLPKVIAALPALAVNPPVPAGWRRARGHQEVAYASRFTVAQVLAGKLRLVVFLSRLVPIAEAVATGLVLYRLGSLLFGSAAGALAGVLWLAAPVTMGLGHLDGVDLPIALAAALTSLALLRWRRRRDRSSLALTAGAAGLAAATGLAGAVVVAVAMAVVTGASWRERGWRALVSGGAVGAGALACLWASYAALDPGVLLDPVLFLPRPYVGGLLFLQAHDGASGWAYLLGTQWQGRRWWYWPGSLLIKTPLPTLLALAAGPLALRAVRPAARREALLTVGLPAVALACFAVFVPPDTGIRYLLPAIPLLLVVASSVAAAARPRLIRAAVAAGAVIAVAIGAMSFPHSISWTAAPFTPGYRYASGSSLDWGQDFYLLVRWSRGRHPYIDFHAGHGLGVVPGARSLAAADPRAVTGWVAVSATLLTARGNAPPAWLRSYCPTGILGGSILIYHFGRPPRSSSPGPALPPGLCRGSRYSHLVTPGTPR